jgi:hypothetical protein
MTESWSYRESVESDTGLSVIDFDVEATDGKIGTVEQESNVAGDSYLVVDTGLWIFGKKALLPASTVTRIDPQEKKVHLARSREEIKNAPEFNENTYQQAGYRRRIVDYYNGLPHLP